MGIVENEKTKVITTHSRVQHLEITVTGQVIVNENVLSRSKLVHRLWQLFLSRRIYLLFPFFRDCRNESSKNSLQCSWTYLEALCQLKPYLKYKPYNFLRRFYQRKESSLNLRPLSYMRSIVL